MHFVSWLTPVLLKYSYPSFWATNEWNEICGLWASGPSARSNSIQWISSIHLISCCLPSALFSLKKRRAVAPHSTKLKKKQLMKEEWEREWKWVWVEPEHITNNPVIQWMEFIDWRGNQTIHSIPIPFRTTCNSFTFYNSVRTNISSNALSFIRNIGMESTLCFGVMGMEPNQKSWWNGIRRNESELRNELMNEMNKWMNQTRQWSSPPQQVKFKEFH